MDSKLSRWIENHKLIVESSVTDGLERITVPDFGTFLYIKPQGDEPIINGQFQFNMSDEEHIALADGGYDYILFEFGGKFYYSKLDLVKNRYDDDAYKPHFEDFKYIGRCAEPQQRMFTHLGVHDEYELLNGSGDDDAWAKKAEFLGFKTLGLCNLNTQASTLAFQTACQKHGIKPIFGETVVVARNYDPESDQIPETYELKLYVSNNDGYHSLLHINRAINVTYSGFIPDEELYKLGKGLICVIPKDSEFNSIITQPSSKAALALLAVYKKSFDSVYYQIDTVEYTSGSQFRKHLKNIDCYIKRYVKLIPPILINDSYYLDAEHAGLKELLNKVAGKIYPESQVQYFKTESETYASYAEWFTSAPALRDTIELAIDNANTVVENIDFTIPAGERKLPKFDENKDVDAMFFAEVQNGINERIIGKIPEDMYDMYMERIEKECSVMIPAGLSDYFMILWDIMNWCRSNNIMVGPGRGSVCGSLVAYLLHITDVDPIKHDLLFERFLNETRVSGERAKSADSMPDIDCDFPTAHRDEVKEYITKKYGVDYACSIGTYGRMKLKTCLKDFGKIKGIPFQEMNDLTKDIDDQIEYVWGDLIEYACRSRQLYQFVQNNPDLVHMTKYALLQPRSASVHPSAVIIVPRHDSDGNEMTIYDWMPVKSVDGVLVSEWEGKYIDKSGFLKEDILGLSQLDKFSAMLELIKQNHKRTIRLLDIPLTDDEVYTTLSRGWAEDIFQFGTKGQGQFLREVKPNSFEQLAVMTALFRPGPMDSGAHHDYAQIKNGKKKPEFDFGLKEVTKNTFGLYAYQEQVMQAVNVLGGLSLIEADVLRTVMKKKDHAKMESFKEKFINGAVERGCKIDEANRIWGKLETFSRYGFNKSHAVAYTLMSYWGQWFKVHYPLEFWTVTLNEESEKKLPYFVSEMKKFRNGITVSPPDINKSDIRFTCNVRDNAIYSSLTGIKGVGEVAVTEILRVREQSKFFSFEEFCSRVPSKVNRGVIEKLVIAGAFDGIEMLENERERNGLIRKLNELKGVKTEKYVGREFESNSMWIQMQKELTGFGDVDLSGLVDDDPDIPKKHKKALIAPHDLERLSANTLAAVVGRVNYIREFTINKEGRNKGKHCARGTIDCNGTIIDFTLWSEDWEDKKYKEKDFKDKIVFFSGMVTDDAYMHKKTLRSAGRNTMVKVLTEKS